MKYSLFAESVIQKYSEIYVLGSIAQNSKENTFDKVLFYQNYWPKPFYFAKKRIS